MLTDLGFVSPEQVEKARGEAAAANVGVVDLLVANKLIRPEDVTQAKAAARIAAHEHHSTSFAARLAALRADAPCTSP